MVNAYSEHVSDTLKKVETEVKDQDENSQDIDVQDTDSKQVEYEEEIDHTSKNLSDVFKEFIVKNPEYSQGQEPDLFEQNPLYKTYQKVEEKFKGESSICNNTEESFKPIYKWNKKDILDWSQKVKDQNSAVEKEFFPELIAVIKQANILASKGQFLRIPQILSLIIFVQDPSKGMLQEIKTGEGKSTNTAALAVMQCLMGHKVDIVTSIPDLAERDTKAKEEFFAMFGLSVAFNSSRESRDKGFKSCYKADIVYGDTSAFQYDWIHGLFDNNVRGKRGYDVLIIDEVDSMCIDEMSKLAMVSDGIAGGEFLYNIYCTIWKHLCYLVQCTEFRDGKYYYNPTKYKVYGIGVDVDNPKEFENEYQDIEAFYQAQLFGCLQDILKNLDAFSLPSYLIGLVNLQSEPWIKSAITAMKMKKNTDYIIVQDKDGYKSIAPVDYQNTGMIHLSTQWGDGVHQFLQIKEKVAFRPESLITRFISNLGFFKLYQEKGKIYGMTGTIGDENTQEMLSNEYGINIAFIPKFKESKFEEYIGIISIGSKNHLDAICKNIDEQTSKGRSVLVICEDIGSVKTLEEQINTNEGLKDCNIKSYFIGGEKQKSAIEEVVKPKDIIIATNLAGRGTDLKTLEELEANGGLHVIITFLPKNARVESQAFGRTARQGNDGSGIMIVDLNSVSNFLELDPNVTNMTVQYSRELRDEYETFRINENKTYKLAFVKCKDKVLREFCSNTSALEDIKPKRKQLQQNFGEILKDIENKQTFGGNFEDGNISTISPAMEFKLSIFEMENHKFYSTKNQTYYDSLYKALSHQINYKLSSAKIKKLLLYKIAAKHMDSEGSDEDALILFAEIFECTIKVFTNYSGIKEFKGKNHQHTFYISAFKNDYTGQKLYQSLVPNDAKDPNYIYEIIKGHRKEIAESESITQAINISEKNKAKAYNETIEKKILQDFNKLLRKQISKYNDRFMIVKDPSFLLSNAVKFNVSSYQALLYLSMAKGPHDYEPIRSRNFMPDFSPKEYKDLGSDITEEYFTYPAYYNYSWILIREKSSECGKSNDPEVKADYMPQAYKDLSVAYQQIKQIVLPNLRSSKNLFENLEATDQLKQIDNRIELYERYLEHIKKVQDKIKNCSKECYIKISSIKTLDELYPPGSAPMSEISELANSGLFCIFDVKEAEFSTNWGAVIALCAVACFQMWAGFTMIHASFMACKAGLTVASFGLSTFTWGSIGFTLAEGGIKDLKRACRVANGEPLNMDGWLHEKGFMIAQIGTQIICDQLWKAVNNKILGKPASDKLGYMYQRLGPIGTYAVNKTIEYVADKLGCEAAEEREEKINNSVKRKTEEFFNDTTVRQKLADLFAQDEINRSQEHYQEIMRALINSFRSKQSILSNTISSIIKSNGINHPGGTILKVGAYIKDGIDIEKQIQELEEITANALNQIKDTINTLHSTGASPRDTLKTYLDQINLTNHDQIISRLEELGILEGQRVVRENIPSDARDITGLGLSLNKLNALKTKLHQIANAYSADYSEHFKGIKNQIDEVAVDYCTGQTKAIGSKIYGEGIGLGKEFVYHTIEKKAVEEVHKAAERHQKQQEQKEFEKQARKVAEETDPVNQYLAWKQSTARLEEIERMCNQARQIQKGAVDEAKRQTIVLSAPEDHSRPNHDQTQWSTIIQKPNTSLSSSSSKTNTSGDQIVPGGMSFPTREESLAHSRNLMSRDPRIIYIEDSNGNPINISDLAGQVRSTNKPLVILADKFGAVRGYYHNLKESYSSVETAEDLVNKTMLGLMIYSNPLVGGLMVGAAYAFPEHVEAIKTNIYHAFGKAVTALEPDLTHKQVDNLASLGNTVVELSTAKYILSSAAAKSTSLISKFKPESKIFTAPNGLTAEIIKLENANYIWNELGYVETGEYIEKILGQNLNQYFKTFDYFDKGVAKSIKTFQVDAKSYNGKPIVVRSRLRGYVDKVDDFITHRVQGFEIKSSQIQERVLEIAVPHLDNPMHQQVFKEIIEYGLQRKNKVKVQIKIIKE